MTNARFPIRSAAATGSHSKADRKAASVGKFRGFCMLAGMSDDAARFRKQAEEAREHAARVASPLDKEAWLRIAEEWLKLSESAENQRRI